MSANLLSTGIYTIPEAARLTRVAGARIRRWLKGYDYKTPKRGHCHASPVWQSQFEPIGSQVAVGFRDLMEVRFVDAFLRHGVSWCTMRQAHLAAKAKLNTDHPFCTHRFATDGQNILLHEAEVAGDQRLLDIVTNQREFDSIVTPFLRELEFDDGVLRWWPLGRERLIVVDPDRNLGQPTVTQSGVPTRVLVNSVKANAGSIESVARWFEVSPEEVRDAVEFESGLRAA